MSDKEPTSIKNVLRISAELPIGWSDIANAMQVFQRTNNVPEMREMCQEYINWYSRETEKKDREFSNVDDYLAYRKSTYRETALRNLYRCALNIDTSKHWMDWGKSVFRRLQPSLSIKAEDIKAQFEKSGVVTKFFCTTLDWEPPPAKEKD